MRYGEKKLWKRIKLLRLGLTLLHLYIFTSFTSCPNWAGDKKHQYSLFHCRLDYVTENLSWPFEMTSVEALS